MAPTFFVECLSISKDVLSGTWVAQSGEPLTLGFGLLRGLRVVGWSPVSGSELSTESACPSPSAPAPLAYPLSLSQIN